ncbi:MAG: hypothetical protein K2X47_14890, partial [Bdellovibrionales bacterium]|nr:hypothetical protein [Bdellovibrionales bacterium]
FLISEVSSIKPLDAQNVEMSREHFSFLDFPSQERASDPFLGGQELKSLYYYKQHPALTPLLIFANAPEDLSRLEILPTNLRALRLSGRIHSGENKSVCLTWSGSPILSLPSAHIEIERVACGKFENQNLLAFARHQKNVDQFDLASIQDGSRAFRPPNQKSPHKFLVRSEVACGIDQVRLEEARRLTPHSVN